MIRTEEILFHIPEPCLADWNSMTPTEKGKHCDLCAKQVFDATNLSPEEIFEILKKQKGNACMRMNSSMLDTPHQIVQPPWYSSLTRYYKKAALFIGMQILFFNQVKAQVKAVLSSDKNSDGVVKKYLKSIKISGMVADSITKAPIPYVKVQVRKKDKIIASTTCKFDGTYILYMKDTIEDNEPASLEFMQTMFDSAVIREFSFNKPEIIIDTVYLKKSFLEVKEIEINVNYSETHVVMGKLPFRPEHVQVPRRNNPKLNMIDLTRLLKTPDPSPRPSRFD